MVMMSLSMTHNVNQLINNLWGESNPKSLVPQHQRRSEDAGKT